MEAENSLARIFVWMNVLVATSSSIVGCVSQCIHCVSTETFSYGCPAKSSQSMRPVAFESVDISDMIVQRRLMPLPSQPQLE